MKKVFRFSARVAPVIAISLSIASCEDREMAGIYCSVTKLEDSGRICGKVN